MDPDPRRSGRDLGPVQEVQALPFRGGTLPRLPQLGERVVECRSRNAFIPPRLAVTIACELARALEHAHANGVLHRDVSCCNVLVSREGEVKLADFGLADARERVSSTAPGQVFGKVHYLSEERRRGQQATPADDLYALGVILQRLHDAADPRERSKPLGVRSTRSTSGCGVRATSGPRRPPRSSRDPPAQSWRPRGARRSSATTHSRAPPRSFPHPVPSASRSSTTRPIRAPGEREPPPPPTSPASPPRRGRSTTPEASGGACPSRHEPAEHRAAGAARGPQPTTGPSPTAGWAAAADRRRSGRAARAVRGRLAGSDPGRTSAHPPPALRRRSRLTAPLNSCYR